MSWDNSGNGTAVKTSVQDSTSILFAANGMTTIRLREKVTTTEHRGVTMSRAEAMAASTDSTTQTTYYRFANGRLYSFTATTGTKTDWTASLMDPSGGSYAVERETEYSVVWPTGEQAKWGTNELDERGNTITLSSSGSSAVVSYDKQLNHVFTYADVSLFETVATTVSEIRRIDTEAHAKSIVDTKNSAANNSISYPTRYYQSTPVSGTTITLYRVKVASGTQTHASARFVSDKEGWTVTVTEAVHGWQQSGNTSAAKWV